MVKKSKKDAADSAAEGVRRITLGEFGVTDTSAPPPELGTAAKQGMGPYKSRVFSSTKGVSWTHPLNTVIWPEWPIYD